MSSSELFPPVNQVFVDFENVQKIDLSVIGARAVFFTLLVDAKQTRFDADLVEKLLRHAASVQLVRLTGSGPHALDFALAYYVGRAAVTDPTAYFHIISRNQGLDSLVDHLRSRQIRARRHNDFSTLTFSGKPPASPSKPAAPLPPPAPPKPPAPKKEPVAVVEPESGPESEMDLDAQLLDEALKYLRTRKKDRPKRIKSLASDLRAHLGRETSEEDVAHVIAELAEKNHLELSEKGAVTYRLDP